MVWQCDIEALAGQEKRYFLYFNVDMTRIFDEKETG
jgi:hypothetical protein